MDLQYCGVVELKSLQTNQTIVRTLINPQLAHLRLFDTQEDKALAANLLD